MITPLGWTVILISLVVGSAGGHHIFKRFPNIFDRFTEDKKMIQVINNPKLLAEKLKANGKIYEEGKNGMRAEIDFKVGIDDKTGKEVIIMEKEEFKIPKVKKKIPKEKIKKKTKGRKKKK